MKSPLEDTIWGAQYGSCAAVQAAFDRIAPAYHQAIMNSGAPARAAACLRPFVSPIARGIDFGCGSGALGLALREAGLEGPLDGFDLSAGMLDLARASGCYTTLVQLNFLVPEDAARIAPGYDYAVTLGVVGDYVPHYLAVPRLAGAVKPGGVIGLGVEPRSTPHRPLLRSLEEQDLEILDETLLEIPAQFLELETYHFFALRRRLHPRAEG